MPKADDDIFGCFGNSFSECVLACELPCLMYGEIVQRSKLPGLNFCSACTLYTCFCCFPCVPGTYLRILRGKGWLESCLSYSFFPCCSLLQDERRTYKAQG